MAQAFAPLRLKCGEQLARSPCAATARRRLRPRSRPPAARGCPACRGGRPACRSAGTGRTSTCRSPSSGSSNSLVRKIFSSFVFCEDLLLPVRLGERLLGGVEQRVGVGAVTRSPVKPRNVAGDVHEPGVLDRVVVPVHVPDDRADAVARRRRPCASGLVAHPGRVGQFGVVVVAEDVVERLATPGRAGRCASAGRSAGWRRGRNTGRGRGCRSWQNLPFSVTPTALDAACLTEAGRNYKSRTAT